MPSPRSVSRERSSFGGEGRPLSSASMTSLGTMAWSMVGDEAPRRLEGGWLRVDQPFDLTGRPTTPYYAHPQRLVSQFEEPAEVLSKRKISMELVRAAKAGSAAEIDKLLSEGADANFVDPMGVSPVMKAAQIGNLDALNRLLEETPDLTLVNEDGRNALHLALYWGQCLGDDQGGCVGALVRAGCARNHLDHNGEFPVDLMCRALVPQPKVHTKRMKLLAPLRASLNCRAINTSDFDEIFDDSEDPFVVQEKLDAQAASVFGLKERVYTFGVVEKGEERRQRIKISNTGTLPCVVSLTIAPQSEDVDEESFPLSIEPKSLSLQQRAFDYVEVILKAGAGGKFTGVFTASVQAEGAVVGAGEEAAAEGERLAFQVRAEVPRDPDEPEPAPAKKGGKKPAKKKKK